MQALHLWPRKLSGRWSRKTKRQKTKTFAVRESPVYDKGAVAMESQKRGHLNKTSTVTPLDTPAWVR